MLRTRLMGLQVLGFKQSRVLGVACVASVRPRAWIERAVLSKSREGCWLQITEGRRGYSFALVSSFIFFANATDFTPRAQRAGAQHCSREAGRCGCTGSSQRRHSVCWPGGGRMRGGCLCCSSSAGHDSKGDGRGAENLSHRDKVAVRVGVLEMARGSLGQLEAVRNKRPPANTAQSALSDLVAVLCCNATFFAGSQELSSQRSVAADGMCSFNAGSHFDRAIPTEDGAGCGANRCKYNERRRSKPCTRLKVDIRTPGGRSSQSDVGVGLVEEQAAGGAIGVGYFDDEHAVVCSHRS